MPFFARAGRRASPPADEGATSDAGAATRPSSEGRPPFFSSGGEPGALSQRGGGNGAGVGASFLPPRAKSAASALGSRTWLRVDTAGTASVIKADKGRLAAELGVQARDLRLLDPHLHAYYPSAILCRDAALVVNIEFVKAVITSTYVLVTNADDGAVAPFVAELSRRLAAAPATTLPSADGGDGPGGGGGGGDAAAAAAAAASADGGDAAARAAARAADTPFELRALEVALEAVCAHLEGLAGDLEAAAHPALDDLTASVNTANLERVRRVKTRLVRLTTRTETLREVLEKILDDDADMHDMNLTARALDELDRERSVAAAERGVDGATPPVRQRDDASPTPGEGGGGGQGGGGIVPAALELLEEEHERDEGEIAQVGGGGTEGGSGELSLPLPTARRTTHPPSHPTG